MRRRDLLGAGAALPMLAMVSNLSAKTPHAVRTDWECRVSRDSSGRSSAHLSVSVNGSAHASFKLRGICYSPCPINENVEKTPSLGDFFWDEYSGPGYHIRNWRDTWQRDLKLIRETGANTIRLYSMISRQLDYKTGGLPKVPFDKSSHQFMHREFLDACWNGGVKPLYVLVGIPVSAPALKQGIYNKAEDAFYTALIKETVAQVSGHPAVLGFTIQNEQDGPGASWGDAAPVSFWWSQIEKFAHLTKVAMGANKKLVGMANHDDLKLLSMSASHMARVPSVDFWGVNTYQTQNFDTVFKAVAAENFPGYEGLTGSALKPVILTEWGMPGTGHRNPTDRTTIYSDNGTAQLTANVITGVAAQALNGRYPLSLGLYYFEFCDEWWKQKVDEGFPDFPDFPYRPFGGPAADAFPNKFWDEDGFGLFAIGRGGGLPNNAPVWRDDGYNKGPNVPDTRSPRKPMVDALRSVYLSY